MTVSVDTMRASVAQAAIEAGVTIVNDVSGGRADSDMARVVADAGVPWVLMHWRPAGEFVHAGGSTHYDDVVRDVRDELMVQVDAAIAAGVDPSALVLDPGLGFVKDPDHNWQLLHALPEFVELGFPVLIGASRKRFLDRCSPTPTGWCGRRRGGDGHRGDLGARRDARRVGRTGARRAGLARCDRGGVGVGARCPELILVCARRWR